ncbi:MAG TPA: amidohydrolase [Propionibacterium sp.]|nr:amidohydrolase [Propionibacterium sp.]
MSGSLLVRGGRIVGLDEGGSRPGDVRIRDGLIVEVGPGLAPGGEPVLDAGGSFLIPGLWDAHVHFMQWVRSTTWVDVAGTAGPDEVCARIEDALATRPDDGRAVIAFGYRSAPWRERPTVAQLDAVTGDRPVVVIAGDAHNGWLNSAALAYLGLPPRTGPLAENDWFPVFGHLASLPGADPTDAEVDAAIARLSALGVVGLVDLELDAAFRAWPARIRRGQRSLRVRAGVYPHQLDEVLAASWGTGDDLPGGEGLATMGPLKIIADGSMGTRTAWCCDPYTDATPDDEHPAGGPNVTASELADLMARAHAGRLASAIHAIGDRANEVTLDAFAATGASGSIEHAQLLRREDVPRFAELGVVASMQPHHLVADRDTAGTVWADRTDRLYLARSLVDAGATLALGSDAPVSPPDPWLAMATAVHRSGDERPGWYPDESITVREALAASVDGQRLVVGGRGDLVVLGADPLEERTDPTATRDHLLSVPVRATVCAGRVTHREG